VCVCVCVFVCGMKFLIFFDTSSYRKVNYQVNLKNILFIQQFFGRSLHLILTSKFQCVKDTHQISPEPHSLHSSLGQPRYVRSK